VSAVAGGIPARHAPLRRWLTYGRLVAGNGFALGNALFGLSAAYLNLSTAASGVASAALFAAGGAVDALHIVAPSLHAYRRRHHPKYRGTEDDGRAHGALERVIAVPGLGQALLGLGAATLLGQSLATGAYQVAAGVGLLAAGHAAFSGAAVHKALRRWRGAPAAGTAGAEGAERRRAREGGRDGERASSQGRRLAVAILRDPLATGAILVGAAAATLPFATTAAGLAAAALCLAGGTAQAVLKHRALARRRRDPDPDHQATAGRLRVVVGASAGYALQAAGLAIAAATTTVPALQLAVGGFATAMMAVSAGSAVRASNRWDAPLPALAPAATGRGTEQTAAARPTDHHRQEPARAAPGAAARVPSRPVAVLGRTPARPVPDLRLSRER
jgi:hypothetical protein